MAEIYTEPGLTILRQELGVEALEQAASSIPKDLDTIAPTFDDECGNRGYVLWQHNDQPAAPDSLLETLGLITSIQVRLDNLRSYQVNIQQPFGEQAFHTDAPFSASLTMQLSPDGLFEYYDNKGEARSIPVDAGDIVIQSRAKELVHRGRNSSASVRYNLAMFFNAQAAG